MRSLLYLLGSVNISWYVVDHVYKECVFIQDYGAISFQNGSCKKIMSHLYLSLMTFHIKIMIYFRFL